MPIPILNQAWIRAPFLLHWTVEAPAAASFLLAPSMQLPGASTGAKLVLRSYGSLLLVTCVQSIFFLTRPRFDDATIGFSAMMAFYHVFPIYRACVRIQNSIGVVGQQGRVLGGPMLHLVLHLACFASLSGAAVVAGLYPERRR